MGRTLGKRRKTASRRKKTTGRKRRGTVSRARRGTQRRKATGRKKRKTSKRGSSRGRSNKRSTRSKKKKTTKRRSSSKAKKASASKASSKPASNAASTAKAPVASQLAVGPVSAGVKGRMSMMSFLASLPQPAPRRGAVPAASNRIVPEPAVSRKPSPTPTGGGGGGAGGGAAGGGGGAGGGAAAGGGGGAAAGAGGGGGAAAGAAAGGGGGGGGVGGMLGEDETVVFDDRNLPTPKLARQSGDRTASGSPIGAQAAEGNPFGPAPKPGFFQGFFSMFKNQDYAKQCGLSEARKDHLFDLNHYDAHQETRHLYPSVSEGVWKHCYTARILLENYCKAAKDNAEMWKHPTGDKEVWGHRRIRQSFIFSRVALFWGIQRRYSNDPVVWINFLCREKRRVQFTRMLHRVIFNQDRMRNIIEGYVSCGHALDPLETDLLKTKATHYEYNLRIEMNWHGPFVNLWRLVYNVEAENKQLRGVLYNFLRNMFIAMLKKKRFLVDCDLGNIMYTMHMNQHISLNWLYCGRVINADYELQGWPENENVLKIPAAAYLLCMSAAKSEHDAGGQDAYLGIVELYWDTCLTGDIALSHFGTPNVQVQAIRNYFKEKENFERQAKWLRQDYEKKVSDLDEAYYNTTLAKAESDNSEKPDAYHGAVSNSEVYIIHTEPGQSKMEKITHLLDKEDWVKAAEIWRKDHPLPADSEGMLDVLDSVLDDGNLTAEEAEEGDQVPSF